VSLRTRKTVAVLCIAVVIVAGVLPGVASAFGIAVLVPLWLVWPAVAVTIIRRRAFRCDDQPVSLAAILDSRAPPIVAALA